MFQPTQGSQLLDRITVQGVAVSISLQLMAEGPISPEEFASAVNPLDPAAPHSELLPFLVESGLARLEGGRLTPSQLGGLVDERLLLLRLLHERIDQNRLFRRVWEELITSEDAIGLIQRDQVWPVLQRRVGAELPRLNSNRMAQWMRLAAYIGLIQPERSNQFLLLPTERWLLSLLRATLPTQAELPVADWVTLVEEQYCKITRRPGVLHSAIAALLLLFESDQQIKLAYVSDERFVQVGGRQVSLIGWGKVR